MSYQDEILHLIHDLDSEFTLQPCFVSATAILLYDTLLTLEKEVNLIWERKFGAISVVYVVNRYVRLMACVLNIALWFPVHDETYVYAYLSMYADIIDRVQFRCHTLLILGSITNVVPYLAWAVFAGLRMHALSNRSIQLTAAVFLLTATFIIPYIFEYSNHASIVNAPYPYNCLLAPQPSRLTQPRTARHTRDDHPGRVNTTRMDDQGRRQISDLFESKVEACTITHDHSSDQRCGMFQLSSSHQCGNRRINSSGTPFLLLDVFAIGRSRDESQSLMYRRDPTPP
ncbi:hypothetical protein C8Q80DRAFT_907193 [Daedaleopsis nitida]|nr:hypothetical protein C8Q80DRAFT_907193 [Daedaleopsis nitida]